MASDIRLLPHPPPVTMLAQLHTGFAVNPLCPHTGHFLNPQLKDQQPEKEREPLLSTKIWDAPLMTLDQLLTEIETRELEFKEKPNPALFKTLSAFANTNGGVVFVGVSDKKEIIGYRCSNADLKELSDTIVNKLAIHPVIEHVKCDGKTVL